MEKYAKESELSSLLFPKVICVCCGAELRDCSGVPICDSCKNNLEFNNNTCAKCGRSLVSGGDICIRCRVKPPTFAEAISVFKFEGVARQLLHKFKFGDTKYLGKVFAYYMYERYLASDIKCDIVVSVPMTGLRKFIRGYNQSEILAEEFCKISNCNYLKSAVVKVRSTKHQMELSANERAKNLSGAFKVLRKQAIAGKHILIIDDVMTTGATLSEIARLLYGAKASKVSTLTAFATAEKILGSSD